LEWAPKDCFTTQGKGVVVGVKAKAVETKGKEADGEGETGTLFVKNLNFSTTAETLKKVFEKVGPVRTASIARKKDKQQAAGGPEKWLSMGYGFVEFKNKEDCLKACKSMQGREIDNHSVQLKVSTRGADATSKETVKRKQTSAGGKKPGTKIMVKNLAFEATAHELRELFGTFGQLKRCRVPKKFDGSHRGFAFIDFVTTQEALNAFKALENTHLYGRHLVLEWAEEEDSLADIREKTVKQFKKQKV
jgi:multiple RNA-binding domain-containing protein 1